jgi:hypothetical protein
MEEKFEAALEENIKNLVEVFKNLQAHTVTFTKLPENCVRILIKTHSHNIPWIADREINTGKPIEFFNGKKEYC